MPRPRFQRLAEEKQHAILEAAATEFAGNGFAAASFNRIIESAGLSKGAMYYYFDDKEDLYMTVLHSYQDEFLGQIGEFPTVETAIEFWAAVEEIVTRAGRLEEANPRIVQLGMSMLKSIMAGELSVDFSVHWDQAKGWLERIVKAGQSVGGVRRDLPADLLVALFLGTTEALDRWLIARIDSLDQIDYDKAIPFFTVLYRRLLEPGDEESFGFFVRGSDDLGEKG